MKAVVTGAKGMLGQDLCPVFEDAGIFVNSFGSKELDVTNYDETRQIIGEISPQIIVNLAAYTNVDKAEEDYDTTYMHPGINPGRRYVTCYRYFERAKIDMRHAVSYGDIQDLIENPAPLDDRSDVEFAKDFASLLR